MTTYIDTDVIIVGGGPVGLVAAADLDARGIKTVVIERRPFLDAPNVKCNHVASRTMERFRLLGFADKIRNGGLPADHPQDVSFRTTVTGEELTRIPIPARVDRFTSTHGPDTDWATPEPPHRINQRFMEPILMEHVAALRNVTLLTETEYLRSSQSESGVEAVALRDGEEVMIRGSYLIGADGGRSAIRKQIGGKLSGDPVLSRVQSTCIRSAQLGEAVDSDRAWAYYTFNPRRNGHVYAIDGDTVFLVHNYLTAEEAEADSVDRDWAIRAILGVGDDFEYEIVSKEDWIARRLVADKFRDRRFFIAGDACHLWVPYAGYGMNAGIADALNLTWVLGAVLSGWADERILDAYESERLPITEQVSKLAMSHQRKIAQGDVPKEIEDSGAEGEASRASLALDAYELNVQQFAAEGLNFGYNYEFSPIISYDEETAPSFTMGDYAPSTVPGCRAPHFWLADGASVYDRLGLYYTVIARGDADTADIEKLTTEARAQQMPLTVVAASSDELPAEYTSRITIVRQDQHVVWRGDRVPTEVQSLISFLRGAAQGRGDDDAAVELASSRD